MLCIPTLCTAKKVVEIPVYRPGVFNSLKDSAADRRVDIARTLSRPCRKMTEADAMRTIDDLHKVAVALDDIPLQCAVFDIRADYYSVNRGYNNLSTRYYKQAVEFAENEKRQMETGIYQHRLANYFFLYKKNIDACRYYLLSEKNLKEVGFKSVPGMGNLFSETANFYYALGDYDDARENLKNALVYQPEPSRTRVNIINTIGLTYRNSGNYPPALNYFNSALKLAVQIHDTVWVALAKGNIGSVYLLQEKYNEALPLIREDYSQSLKYGQDVNSAIAMLRIVRISLKFNNATLAAAQLDTVDKVLSVTSENVLNERIKYYDLLAQVKSKLKQPAQAEHYRLISEQLMDSLAKRDNIAAIERIRLQWLKQKSREDFNNLKKSANVAAYKQNTIIVVLLLLIVIGILVFNRQRLKAKKDRALLASELLRLEQERKNAEAALSGYTENLRQKNEMIEGFKRELERLQITVNDREFAANLEKLMQAHIMTDESWEDFKKLFTKVHRNFFHNLRHKYEGLSDTDVRLLALIKLKLNNKEMAGMLGITVDGVKKAKQRLRKKMNIDDNEEVETVVNML
ncbi:tetratricopeptide repeat protein [Mucilaginibacter conchicola]|uniref:Tetratricopeptide repeat protein n=2 Tax=Mucilaginibacter conchicola TaxID=2303333 RepID=A0A372NSD3_9SPHI|nr:tetratricopeptide repeat protein [Mucilaginibacter conchicola]